jgi:hypothetical protein
MYGTFLPSSFLTKDVLDKKYIVQNSFIQFSLSVSPFHYLLHENERIFIVEMQLIPLAALFLDSSLTGQAIAVKRVSIKRKITFVI